MIQNSKIIGVQLYFVRENDTYSTPAIGGMVSPTGRNSRPTSNDPAWMSIGVLDMNNFDVEQKREQRDVYAATPGQIRHYDAITTKRGMDFKFVEADMQPLTFELLFGTLPMTYAGTNKNYNPLSGVEKRGWLQMQFYDQTDTLMNTLVNFGNLMVEGAMKFGDDIVKTNFTFTGLHSIYNAGTLV